METTRRMLEAAKEQQIDTIVATPHFYADRMTLERFFRKRDRVLEQTRSLAAQNGIRLFSGAEVAYFHGMSTAEGLEAFCIENTELFLLEMPFRAWTNSDVAEVSRLIERGFQIIFAHLERFYSLQEDPKILPALLELPVLVQVNAASLLGPLFKHRGLKQCLRGVVLLGSDCHNLSGRPENLQAGREALAKKAGRRYLEQSDELAQRLLGLL